MADPGYHGAAKSLVFIDYMATRRNRSTEAAAVYIWRHSACRRKYPSPEQAPILLPRSGMSSRPEVWYDYFTHEMKQGGHTADISNHLMSFALCAWRLGASDAAVYSASGVGSS